jgi:hypothetical protein
MLRIFGDFETYYDTAYSLRRMSPIEYILNQQWETLGCSVAIEHEAPMLLPQDEIAPFLKDIKQPYCFISHNALFDACVLAFRYGIRPEAILCTLSMSRALLYHEIPNGRLSLGNILKHLKLPEKPDFIGKMNGKRFKHLVEDPGLMMLWVSYVNNDVEGCREIFFYLKDRFPGREALIMDRVLKMATTPVLHINTSALVVYRDQIKAEKQELLDVIKADPSQLTSNQKFAALLENLGVDPPTKISPTTGKLTYAFAKSDHAFMDLLEHDDPDVQALVAARLGVKTTIEESRSTRLIFIGACTTLFLRAPLLPVPLKFSGAHTHRLSGDWQLNLQNLGSRKTRAIRSAIFAPEGMTIVAVDAAQIEARLTAWLAGQLDLIDMFRRGEDTYRAFAAEIFRRALLSVSKTERFVGKQCILGLGFGMSALKLYRTIITLAREQGIEDIIITLQMCEEWVRIYRRKFYKICRCWDDLGWLIDQMARGRADGYTFGPCTVEGTTVILPSGLRLYYDNLREDNGDFYYDSGQFTKKLYGGKFLENVVQALDRQHVMDAGIRTEMRMREMVRGTPAEYIVDPRMLLNVHDENVYCVPDEYADMLAQIAWEEMRRSPEWGPDLPLAAEVKIGWNYGELQEWHPLD